VAVAATTSSYLGEVAPRFVRFSPTWHNLAAILELPDEETKRRRGDEELTSTRTLIFYCIQGFLRPRHSGSHRSSLATSRVPWFAHASITLPGALPWATRLLLCCG
jgi:hypothetical protein